jgi:5-(carboxyamino)imidazole ribonucleotide mutase
MNSKIIKIGIIMGSKSDLPVMQAAGDILSEFGIGFEMTIVSAHRTPEKMFDYAKQAARNGCLDYPFTCNWRTD